MAFPSKNAAAKSPSAGTMLLAFCALLPLAGCGNGAAPPSENAAPDDPDVPTSSHVSPPTGPTIAELRTALGVDSNAEFQKRGGQVVIADLNNQLIDDLSALKGLPLTLLDVTGTSVNDLSPLAGMPLDTLLLAKTGVTDLSPLADSPLERLSFAETEIADLSPLAGRPLTTIDARDTKVVDLSPLKGMPLQQLVLLDTPVSDIAPLSGLPLTFLDLFLLLIRRPPNATRRPHTTSCRS